MTATPTTTPAEFHRQAVRAPLSEVAGLLQEVLSQGLTAYIVGKDPRTIARWVSGEVKEIRDIEVERKLRTTYEIVIMLLAWDAPQTVKAWFVSMNPELDDVSAVEAIRDGALKEAREAALTFVAYG